MKINRGLIIAAAAALLTIPALAHAHYTKHAADQNLAETHTSTASAGFLAKLTGKSNARKNNKRYNQYQTYSNYRYNQANPRNSAYSRAYSTKPHYAIPRYNRKRVRYSRQAAYVNRNSSPYKSYRSSRSFH